MWSTWREVGPVTTAFDGDRVCSHHSTARAAAQSFPDPLHPTTDVRRDSATLRSTSSCFEYGSPPSISRTNSTGDPE